MKKPQPNILLLVTDDQRYDTIAALGNPDIITPNLDQLVAEGTAYTNAYIEGGFTGAVCMPSRAMLNTGRHLCGLYNLGEDVPTEHISLGETLKQAGYYCFGTGKWHNGTPAFTRSFDNGKNIFFGGMWDHWNVPVCHYDPLGNYDNEINFVANFFASKQTISVHCDTFNPGVHSTDLLTGTTIGFLQDYANGSIDTADPCENSDTLSAPSSAHKPFFCYTAFLAPHDPRTMPKKYLDMYKDRPISLPENCTPTYPVAYEGKGMRDEDLTPYPRDLQQTASELRDYYAMITHLDDQIGSIMDTLKEQGMYDNTIIILCGDNGLGIGSHGFLGKQNTFEHSIKVPLIMRGPGIPQGQQVSANVLLTDIYPTLCDVLDIETPDSVMGKSFAHTLREADAPTGTEPLQSTTPHRTALYHMIMDRVRTVRDGDYKLSVYIDPAGNHTTTLHNIAEDPLELTNLSESNLELTQEYLKKLVTMRDKEEDMSREPSRKFWEKFVALALPL